MRFPQAFIDDLRRQADIVRLISDYVPLKKKGANWMACCPFHQEKTPSFSVNPAKDIYYCFGCAKGGSVFNFVMELERVTFPEAVRIVAEKTGVPLPAMENAQRFESRRREGDEIVRLNTWALEWWEAQLRESSAEAAAARAYLDGRGISEETRALFRLGYAPDRWDGLSAHLEGRGASAAEIERSGLVVKKERGGFYDRFRGRVIFPVLDVQGRPVAFGGRTLTPGGEPKYLNSPETPLYTKGRHLFGLHLTREEIKKRGFAILVEGYLDLLVPYQHGIRNAVASLGTALTPEQAKLLGRFARRVVVNYDGDRAGIQAAKRATEALLAEDFEVKVLVLPENADPDEFVSRYGAEAYHERRGKALPHIQFILEQAAQDRHLLNPPEKRAAIEEVLPSIRAVRNPILKREYFDYAMDLLRVDTGTREAAWKDVKGPGQTSARSAPDPRGVPPDPGPVIQPTIAEQQLLELLVHDEELRREMLPHVAAEDYEALPTAAIFEALKELSETGAPFDFADLRERTAGDAVAADFVPFLSLSEPQRAEGEATDDVRARAEDCLATIRAMNLDRRLAELSAQLAAAERAGQQEEGARLAMEHLELKRRRGALRPGAAALG